MRARILLRESRLWFTQTMQEFRRACGKNLPHGLHGEGIVEAKTTEGLMPAHRPCLRAVAEQNSGRFLNRRPERSTLTLMLLDALEAPWHGSDTRTAQKEAPNYSLAHRIYDGSSSHNSETAHICTEIGWVPQEIAPSKDKQDPAQCSSARTRKVLASFGTVKHEPGDTMILPKGRIAGYSSLSPSHHYHHRHSSLHMSQVSQSPTIRYLIQQF